MMNPYHILVPDGNKSFPKQLKELHHMLESTLGGYQKYHIVCARIFLSDAINQYDMLKSSAVYHDYFAQVPTSIIEQPPLDDTKIAVLYKISKAQDEEFDFQPMRLTADEAEEMKDSCYEQTLRLFDRYIESIELQGLDMATHLVRTWIYVRDVDHDYADVVRARNEVFARHGLTADTHFIASTGIGGATELREARVAIDFLTYPHIEEKDKYYLKALDKLNPTHEYGVAFERGTRITTPRDQRIFISGTASIDSKGQVVHQGDMEEQFYRLFENIEALLKDGGSNLNNIDYFVVYLRDTADHNQAVRLIRRWYPRTPLMVCHAKVCRPEWLIEVECVAH